MEEVVGDWRRLHNEGLHNFYTSPNILRMKGDHMEENEIDGSYSTHVLCDVHTKLWLEYH